MSGAGEDPPLVQGAKRKASCMEDMEPSQTASRTCPPIKLEPGSPERLESEESSMRASGRSGNRINSSGNGFGDVVYNRIPDYAPPTSTLPTGNPHILEVHWPQKAVIDLSNDPDRHMLHEAEIRLATSLNLSCAKYLCTKRRIFQARLQALQEGREFKRTDSQRACKIDTNKASKICRAFEKVGWLDKKHFLGYLDEKNNPWRRSNNECKDMSGSSSGLSEPDLWDVSESEFHFTSEEDEESGDEHTADSSVSLDCRQEEPRGGKNLDLYPDPSLRKQPCGSSLTGGDGSQERVRDGTSVQRANILPRNEAVHEGPMTEDRRASRGLVLNQILDHEKPASFSADDTEDFPLLETRSMTQKMKLAQTGHAENPSASFSTVEAKNSQQKSGFDKPYQGETPTDQFPKRNPIPRSLDKANAADVMLVEMKEKCCPWLEIEQALEKQTGKAQTTKSLSRRYARIMENFASTRVKTKKRSDKVRSLPGLQLEPDNDHLLLATEAEIEEKFQQEKADILAEIESNFQSEKWGLVAEAMSRAGTATYSAELVQARYERLTTKPKKAVAKDKVNPNTFLDPRQTPRAVGRENPEIPTPSRSGTGRLDKASNAIDISADRAERGHQTVRKCGPQNHAEHSARMRRVWAKRRSLGTDGHYGGRPEASTIAKRAKLAVPTTAPSSGTSLTPAISYPSGHVQDSSSNEKQPTVLEEEVGRDANQHKYSLAQIIPAAALADNGPKRKKPPRKHGAKRHTCRTCGMTYVNKSNHYRVFPKVGSEHRRRMTANRMAAETQLGPAVTDVGLENASDIPTGQMVFEVSSKP